MILPHLEREPSNDDKQLLLWMETLHDDQSNAFLLAPIHAAGNKNDILYDYIRRQLKIKTDHETSRLLYVAATRTKRELHLLFNLKTEQITGKPAANSLLEKLWPAIHTEVHLPPSTENQEHPAALTRLFLSN